MQWNLGLYLKLMTRRCSHCGHNGHNSRTCPDRGVKLFGVKLLDGSTMQKSQSATNLMQYDSSSGAAGDPGDTGSGKDEYLSDEGAQAVVNSKERKKGVPWTEEEHRLFLIGLNKLGKGDWRGISRNFVLTRTPTQVASHAQKYFIRQNNLNKRKRRSSLFDINSESISRDNDAMLRSASSPSLPVTSDKLSFSLETSKLGGPSSSHSNSAASPVEIGPVPSHLSAFSIQDVLDLNRSRSYSSVSQAFHPPVATQESAFGRHASMPLLQLSSSGDKTSSGAVQDARPDEELRTDDEVPATRAKYYHGQSSVDPWLSHRMGYEMMLRLRQESAQPGTSLSLSSATSLTPLDVKPEADAATPMQMHALNGVPAPQMLPHLPVPTLPMPFTPFSWHPISFVSPSSMFWQSQFSSSAGVAPSDASPKVHRPTAMLPTAPISLSDKGLSCAEGEQEASDGPSLTLKLFEGPSRQSAFQASVPSSPPQSPEGDIVSHPTISVV